MTSLKKDVEEVRHFIIAVDFSKNSQEAFAWALKNLIRAGDVIHLVNARPGSHAVSTISSYSFFSNLSFYNC